MIVVEKKESGLLGFIINKPLDYEISDVLPEIKMNFPLYNGGPVEQDNLFFIHNAGDLIPGSIRIDNKLSQNINKVINSISLKNDDLQNKIYLKNLLNEAIRNYSG